MPHAASLSGTPEAMGMDLPEDLRAPLEAAGEPLSNSPQFPQPSCSSLFLRDPLWSLGARNPGQEGWALAETFPEAA